MLLYSKIILNAAKLSSFFDSKYDTYAVNYANISSLFQQKARLVFYLQS